MRYLACIEKNEYKILVAKNPLKILFVRPNADGRIILKLKLNLLLNGFEISSTAMAIYEV